MIYLPKKTTKFLLIVLSATITFHFVLMESQRFSVRGLVRLNNATKSQYQDMLDKMDWPLIPQVLNRTKVEYLSGMVTEEVFYIIYSLYFLIAVGLIFIIRTTPKQNEEKQLHNS